MNKKQGVIIVVLLALIVCAGVLATKLNSDLDYVAGNQLTDETDAISLSETSQNTSGSNFFQENQIIRDNKTSQTLQTIKALIDDKNTSNEDRAELSKKYTSLALASTNQSQIETILKSKGYENVLCYVQDNKVTVILKSKDKLTDNQKKQIQDVAVDVTQIRDVEIQLKE